MPIVNAPATRDAATEVEGRIATIDNQIAEAGRMFTYFTRQAQDQREAAAALRDLRKSYDGLLEDAGVKL